MLPGLLAVAIGAALAAAGTPIAVEPVAQVLLASLLLLAGGRALRADARLSRPPGEGGRRATSAEAWTGTAFLPLGILLLALGVWQGFAAVEARGWPLFWLGIATGLLAAAYARGPALREHGLGEVTSFFLFGPLPVLAGFVAATGRFSWLAVAGSLPLGLLATGCFVAAAGDAREGGPARGWAATFSRRALERVFLVLVAVAYAWICYGAVRRFYPALVLAVLVTIPWAARAYAALRHAAPRDGGHRMAADAAIAAYLAFAAVLLAALLAHLAMGAPAV